MKYSRRDFLMMGSAASTLWLTGCGGGGSANGLPTAGSAGSGVCAADPLTAYSSYRINFSNTVGLPNADLPFMSYWDNAKQFAPIFGCSNQLVTNVEDVNQELYLSIVQVLTAAQTCTVDLIRTLRLRLSIPHDYGLLHTIQPGDSFVVGDPTNPSAKVFSGELIVTAPTQVDGSNSWAYRITQGTVKVDTGYNGLASVPLVLTNVVATAAQAGSGNNAAFNAGGSVQMDGSVNAYFESLTAIGVR